MKFYLIFIIITLIIGCEKRDKEEGNSFIINKIENNITSKESSIGCEKNNEECEEELDSINFILSTLEKKSTIEDKESNMTLIKERLNLSIDEIVKDRREKNSIKDELESLVNELSENRKEKLENFLHEIDNGQISSIKENLTLLIEEEDKVKPKEIKDRLKSLISDVTDSTDSLSETEKSIKNLVKDIDNADNPSVKKFTNAITTDISNKKIKILKETDDSFVVEVEEGDNLSSLANRYYNDSSKYMLIYEANIDKIGKNYEIYQNSKLVIPKIK